MWILGKPSPYDLMWRDYPDVWYSDSDNPIGIVSYIPTANQSEASVVTYQSSNEITHSARPIGDGSRYISKWGYAPIVNHPPAEVPGYSSVNAYYKINPAYRPVGSGDPVARYWSTIANALNGAVSGSLIRVISGTQSLSGSIQIPSGITLGIKSGTAIDLNGYSIIFDGGTLSNQGTINGLKAKLTYSSILKGLFPTIQSAVNYAPAGYSVDLLIGTYNENVSVSCKNNLTIYGTTSTYLTGAFTFYGCSNLNLLMSTYNQGNAYYCDYGDFNFNLSGSSSQTGIGFYYCIDFNQCGNIYGYNTGLFASGSSGWSQLSNYSSNNKSIFATSGANVGASGNRYYESITYDYEAESYVQISSYSCYFRNGSPRYTTRTGGTVSFTDSRNCGSAKVNADRNEQNDDFQPMQIESDDPIEQEFLIINSSYFNLMKKIKEDKVKGISDNGELKNQFLKIAEDFKAFIKKYPNSSLARVALTTAATSFGLFSKEDGFTDADKNKSFLDEIINDKELTSLTGVAEVLMIDYYRNIKDFNKAISQADAVINKYKQDDELSCDAKFKKGLLLSYEMKQPEKAVECFKGILKNYPDNPIAGFAENQLNLLGYDVQKDEGNLTLTDKSEFTSGAYPNPFNPSTTIRFNLPEEGKGKVIVMVFDILGREIAVLLNEYKQSGSYNVVWNGKDAYGSEVSSGVYFYNIRYNDQSLTKKMMLVR